MFRTALLLSLIVSVSCTQAQDKCFDSFLEVPVPGTGATETADIDNDGDVDLLIGAQIFLNTGDGQNFTQGQTLTPPMDSNTTIHSLADFDSDGDADVAQFIAFNTFDDYGYPQSSLTNIYLWINDGSGAFSITQEPTTLFGFITSVTTGLIDADGFLDFAVLNTKIDDSTNRLQTILNSGNASFNFDRQLGNLEFGGSNLIIEDLDGDGINDILTTCGREQSTAIFRGVGDGAFGFYSGTFDFLPGLFTVNIAAGDFDGDGDVDVLTSEPLIGFLLVGINDGQGNITLGPIVGDNIPFSSVSTGDFDGDGDLDFSNGDVFLNEGCMTFTRLESPAALAVADMNGDGRDDLISSSSISLSQLPALGDVDLNGTIDLLDVSPFVDAIVSQKYQAEADVNRDCMVDLLDVAPFVGLISGTNQECQSPTALEVRGTTGNDIIDVTVDASGITVTVNGTVETHVYLSVDSIVINGFTGNDTITSSYVDTIINAGGGVDIVAFNDLGSGTINGGPGNDIITGSCGSDILIGGNGDDEIRGGFGADVLMGSSGDDCLFGEGSSDTLTGGGGIDLLNGGSGTDTATDTGEAGEVSIEIHQ